MSCFYVGGAVITFISAYFYLLLQNKKNRHPELFHGNSKLITYVINKVKRLSEPFSPSPLCRNGHLQTVLPALLPGYKLEFRRENLALKDGGMASLDWVVTGTEEFDEDRPIMIIVPTLTGDAQSMSSLCHCSVQRGLRPVVFNKRGLGNTPLATPKLQSFGDTSDFREAIEFIRERYPTPPLSCVGSSAGSALLASYLGDYGDESDIVAGAMISPGYKGEMLFIKKTPTWPYDKLLLNNLKGVVKKHAKVLSEVLDIEAVMNAKNLAEFDLLVYCKIYGYKDLEEYWLHNEPARNLKNASTPIMVLNSADDPVALRELIMFDLFEHPLALLAYTQHGGHCGFLEGWTMESWADKLCVDYVMAVLEYKQLGHKI